MTEINFTEGDVGKWVFNIMSGRWEKIIGFNDDSIWPVETNNDIYSTGGLSNEKDKLPTLLPADHPAVIFGKLEIHIPPPPKKKIVLPAGRYHKMRSGRIHLVGPTVYVDDIIDEFELTEPVVLVEREK